MHVDSVYLLRQALHLDPPGTPVKVIDSYQLLGEIAPDLQGALGVDVVGLGRRNTNFAFPNDDWKPWMTSAGTPVLVPGKFNTIPEPNGNLLQYPEGDTSAPPSGRMPTGGYYFDAIIRQEPIDDEHLDPQDNLEQYTLLSDDDLAHIGREVERLAASGRAILANFGTGTSFGDVGGVPAVGLKHPKGIRDIEEYYISHHTRRDYIYEVFSGQCEIGLQNLARAYAVAGDRVTIVFVTATDLGAQQGPFISPRTYRELYMPFFTRVNDWVHTHTPWKTFLHSCGSLWRLLDDIVASGVDILNPVQTSAAEMDPAALKARYGDRLTFWGGGVDTQHVLPFGTPEEVRAMVRERMRVFGPGGGFVFNTIHNVQTGIPVANLLALYEAVRDYRPYPLR
jgi:hypothetical protein